MINFFAQKSSWHNEVYYACFICLFMIFHILKHFCQKMTGTLLPHCLNIPEETFYRILIERHIVIFCSL